MLLNNLKSVVHWWKSVWFPETTGLQLALCRIIIVAVQLFFFFPSLDSQLMFLQPFRGFIDPQIIIVAISKILPGEIFPTAEAFKLIYWSTVGAGITTLIGFFTRISAFGFALGNWILIAHVYSYGEDHHPEAILCIFLMLLAFSPAGRRLSVDALIRRIRSRQDEDRRIDTAIWPVKLVQVLLCFAYMSTGLAKVIYGGLAWMNGYTLQQIIFSSAVTRDIPLGVWLAQYHMVCLVLSVGVIFFEVFFFISLMIPKTVPLFLTGGVLLHTGIYVAEGSDFFQYIVLYVVFLDLEKWWLRASAAMQNLAFGGQDSRRRKAAAEV